MPLTDSGTEHTPTFARAENEPSPGTVRAVIRALQGECSDSQAFANVTILRQLMSLSGIYRDAIVYQGAIPALEKLLHRKNPHVRSAAAAALAAARRHSANSHSPLKPGQAAPAGRRERMALEAAVTALDNTMHAFIDRGLAFQF